MGIELPPTLRKLQREYLKKQKITEERNKKINKLLSKSILNKIINYARKIKIKPL